MPERRLLALSYCFPPMALPEAPLIAKRLVNLPGWQADVIAAAPYSPSMGRDDDLIAYSENGIRSVTRLTPSWPLPWDRLRMLSRIPDALRVLNGQVVRTAEAFGISNFPAMLSWSTWHSIHLAARAIKRRHPRIRWLAHFSDPWVGNPFGKSAGIELQINRFLERHVIEQADRVLFTTPEAADLVMGKYPSLWRDKVRVIPHGFDPALYSGAKPPPGPGRKLVARYLGNFYGARSPAPLYRALARAIQLRPSLASELVVELVGQAENDAIVAPTYGLPEGIVVRRPSVGYRESLRLMETADLLLVIDAPAAISVFLPSKLVDYIGSGRPIVGFTPRGASHNALAAAGYPTADPEDVEAGAAGIIAGLELAARPGSAGFEIRDRYTAARTAAALAAVLDEVTAA